MIKSLPFLLMTFVLAAPAAAALSDAGFLSAMGSATQALHESFTRAPLLIASLQEDDVLVAMLRDPDAGVRRAAARGLKPHVNKSVRNRQAVLAVAFRGTEDLSVRREAIKTLSAAAHNPEVYSALLAIGRRAAEPELRAIAYKALYLQAPGQPNVSRGLLEAAKSDSDPAVRKAALWGLFFSSQNSQPRALLMAVAARDKDSSIRQEALKSLYGAMGYADVRDLTFAVVHARTIDPELRYTAILMQSSLHTAAQRDLLQLVAREDPDPKARRAAAIALAGARQEAIYDYFHLALHDDWGRLIQDPLDFE